MKFQQALCSDEVQCKVSETLAIEKDDISSSSKMVTLVSDILLMTADASLIKRKRHSKLRNVKHKKWYDENLKEMKRIVQQNSKLLQKYPNIPNVRHAFFTSLKRYNKCRKQKARQYKENVLQQLDDLKDNNPTAYWKLLKDLKNEEQDDKSKQISIEEWELYFKTLNRDKYENQNIEVKTKLQQLDKETVFNDTDFKITPHEISRCIKKLKNKKSPGFDRILPEMIKYSQHVLLPVFEKLFNSILLCGKYPSEWLSGYIVPIYKKGDATDPGNYRGITISSCVGKLFNLVLNERISKFFEDHDIISKNQIGFKKKHRTSDHIFVLNTLINKYISKGKQLYTCFIDLQKAFDTVNRTKLLYKLKQTGIGTLMFNIIKDMYISSKATLAVKIGNQLSQSFTSNIGVYQGDVLSPILFNMYVDDITRSFDETCDPVRLDDAGLSCLLYADDLVLLSTTETGLQNAVQKLSNYCKTWDLKINTSKTKVIVFNKGGKKLRSKIYLDGQLLECEDSYKYLGLVFASNGKLTPAKEDLSKRGHKAIFKMKTMFKNASVGYETSMHLFSHIVKPILLYASDVWGHTLIKKGHLNINALRQDEVENCHIKFCRYTLGISRKAPNIGIYGETGRYPLAIEAVINTVKYWFRAKSMNPSTLVHKAYIEMQNADCNDTWNTAIQSVLAKANITHTQSESEAIKQIRAILCDQYLTFWKHKLFDDKNKSHGNKLRSYRTYKDTFQLEEYLKIKSKPLRSEFTRLRLSAHKLHIETGRYVTADKRKEPEDRLCSYCNLNMCEDEYHFVMKCLLYEDYRDKMYKDIDDLFPCFKDYNEGQQFIWLMSNLDEDIINIITTYVYNSFTKRRNTINTQK